MNFESAHNYQETLVFARVLEVSAHYPLLAGNQDLLVDAACIALNELKPRYIRHRVDLSFYLSDAERAECEAAVSVAVETAFNLLNTARRKERR
jgi:hypothetical protein